MTEQPSRSTNNILRRLRKRRRKFEVMNSIFNTQEGKEFLEYFLEDCHFFKKRLARNETERIAEESRRTLALSYLEMLAMDDPQLIIQRLETKLEDRND